MGNASKASSQGSTVYAYYYSRNDCDYSSNYNMNDEIAWYQTRSCRILHGSYSWLATATKNIATLGQTDAIEHWWVTIKTKNGNYYQLQFRGPCKLIELRKCGSSRQCDLHGLYEADKETDSSIWTESSYSYSPSGYTIGDVVSWIKSHQFSANYSLISHNCQDLCKAFYRKF